MRKAKIDWTKEEENFLKVIPECFRSSGIKAFARYKADYEALEQLKHYNVKK